MVLLETLRLVGAGIVVGIPIALLFSRYIESLLYGLKSYDALTLSAGILILAAIGGLAGLIPARRAAAVDPMIALRYE